MPDLDDFDDDLDDAADSADENGYVRIKRDDLKALRKKSRRADKLERETAEWRRERAIAKAGLDKLKPAQQAALLKYADSDDADALKAAAEELFGAPEQTEVDAEVAAHAEAEAAVTGAAPANSGVLKPEDVNGWPPERLMRLNQDHPTVFEALMRGETVPAPTAA